MKKAALHNLGCKVNSYETDAMQELLEKAGYSIVPFSEEADVYVINTCSVTAMADKKSRQMIHRAKQKNPDAIVVATGCYIQTSTEAALEDLSIDIILGNNKKGELINEIKKYETENQRVADYIDINDGFVDYETLHISKTAEHTRAFIKVQDGCNQFCSYCLIPYARGRVRSRDIEDVIEEVKGLADASYQEVVLTGIHLSSYGVKGEYELIDLIERVAEVEGIKRIRLGSLEPQVVTEEFAERISKIDKMCPHFHLSLQSGSDTVLKRMNRKYTASEYKEGCARLRKVFPHVAITTDVIVGFPGETDEEFNETVAFLKDINFYEMHIFKFSRRKGTRAYDMENQVAEEVKTARSNVLLKMADDMSLEFREYYMNQEVDVLMEEPVEVDGEKYFVGFTKEYVKVAVKDCEDDLHNTIVTGKIIGKLKDDLLVLG